MKEDIELIDVNMDETDKGVKAAKVQPDRTQAHTAGRKPIRKNSEPSGKTSPKKTKKKNKALNIVGKVCLCMVTFLVVTFVGAYMTLWTICHGPSKAARDLFVSTILETGQMKFLASWYFDEDEILAITNRNGMVRNEENVNPDLIEIPTAGEDDGRFSLTAP